MACPHFLPIDRTTHPTRPHPARTPLGALFGGVCKADSTNDRIPDADRLYDHCNFGYGRGHCPWFPQATDGDAVRFTQRGAKLIYIMERDYSPLRHGPVERADELLRAQSEIFRHHHPTSHE